MSGGPLLFVYGTLKRGSRAAERQSLEHGTRYLGEARLQAKLFQLDGYPGAVRSSDPQDQVHGELYALEDPALLATLDSYEGDEYRRESVQVQPAEGGPPQAAWAYLFVASVEGRSPVPGGRFLV